MGYRSLPFHYGLPSDTYRLVGVATSRAESAKAATLEIGCDFGTDDYRTLLARPDVDVVDICVPNYLHAEIVEAAAAAGKHIYCEKPLAMDLAEGRRMLAAVEAAGVLAQMTFNFRFYPAVLRAQQLIREGFLGTPFSFRGRYYRSSYIDRGKPISWKQRREIAGGGALIDIGSHILDLLYALLGDYASVNATLDTLIRERPRAAGSTERVAVDVDDIALLHVRLADGTPGTVEASRLGTGLTNELEFEIFGDQGSVRFNAMDPNWLQIYDVRDSDQPMGGRRGFRKVETVQRFEGQKAPDWSMAPDFVRTHTECQYQFLKAVQEGRSPVPSLADGFHIQAVLAAAQRSAAEGRWVTLDEVLGNP
jgi:predicted dehydrogenase